MPCVGPKNGHGDFINWLLWGRWSAGALLRGWGTWCDCDCPLFKDLSIHRKGCGQPECTNGTHASCNHAVGKGPAVLDPAATCCGSSDMHVSSCREGMYVLGMASRWSQLRECSRGRHFAGCLWLPFSGHTLIGASYHAACVVVLKRMIHADKLASLKA